MAILWQELMSVVRTQLADFGQDAWSDDEIVTYFRYAQEQACRKGYLIWGTTTTTLVADTKTYAFPANTIAPIRLKRSGDSYQLEHRNSRYLDARYGNWEATAGACRIYVTDQASRNFTVYPYPNAADITANGANLIGVWAELPTTAVTWSLFNDGTSTPEIPDHYHLELCHYVRYMCLQKEALDIDESSKRSAEALSQFNKAMEAAKKEMISERGQYNDTPLPRVW